VQANSLTTYADRLDDDYMPMPINNLEEYDKVVNVSWYTPDKIREELK
jgi:hypothetical protein